MNYVLIGGGILTWLAIGAVIAGVTDAYLRKKPGSPAGIAMGMVFWPIALALACLGFLGVGLWALNKIAYEEARRIQARRAIEYSDGELVEGRPGVIERVGK